MTDSVETECDGPTVNKVDLTDSVETGVVVPSVNKVDLIDSVETFNSTCVNVLKVLPSADIGYCAGSAAEFPISKLTDENRVTLLNNHWKPPSTYVLPYSTRTICGKQERRYLRHEHLEKYKFLAFSRHRQGLFCKIC